MDDKEKLYLMIEEYKSVRSEESDRLRIQYQLYGTGVAVSAAVFIFGMDAGIPRTAIISVLAVALLLSLPIVLLQGEIDTARRRAREIDQEINARTGDRLFSRASDRVAVTERFRDVRRRTENYTNRWRRGLTQLKSSVQARGEPPNPAL